MGIHARDNLSAYSNQVGEPCVTGHYDYDQYVIVERGITIVTDARHPSHSRYGECWSAMRSLYKEFRAAGRDVQLYGLVFN